MIWWVAAGIFIVMATFIYTIIESPNGDEVIFFTVGATACCGVIALVLNLVLMQVGYETGKRTRVVGQLQNIHDGQGLHGAFFLGTGVVDSYPEYTYYIRNADGSYALRALNSNDVKVWQDDSQPRLECTYEYLKHDHDSTLSIFGPMWSDGECDSYAFHVPPGSIVNDYVLGKKNG